MDDITIIGPSSPFVKEIKQQLNSKFDCKDLGDANTYWVSNSPTLRLESVYPSMATLKRSYYDLECLTPDLSPHHLTRICHYGKRNQAQKSRALVYTKASSDPLCMPSLELDQILPTLLRSYHNFPPDQTKYTYKLQNEYYDT